MRINKISDADATAKDRRKVPERRVHKERRKKKIDTHKRFNPEEVFTDFADEEEIYWQPITLTQAKLIAQTMFNDKLINQEILSLKGTMNNTVYQNIVKQCLNDYGKDLTPAKQNRLNLRIEEVRYCDKGILFYERIIFGHYIIYANDYEWEFATQRNPQEILEKVINLNNSQT